MSQKMNFIEYISEVEQQQLLNNTVSQEFPENILSICRNIIPEEEGTCIDCRNLPAFTIDNPESKDLDDAINLVHNKDRFDLYIHIINAARYVPYGSLLDEVITKRAITHYLITQNIPMMPRILSERLCSIVPNENREAKTIMIRLDNNANILSYNIFKSIICSRVKGNYPEVNRLISGKSNTYLDIKYREVRSQLSDMKNLYTLLLNKRIQRGSIPKNNEKPKIIVKKDKVELIPKKRGIAEGMIEEFMITANSAISHYMYAHGLPMIHRTQDKKKHLASYSPHKKGHADLNLEDYVHFTSPARRISDLKNAQILLMHLQGFESRVIHSIFDDNLEEMCEIATKRSCTAKQIEERCNKICYELFFSQTPEKLYIGTIVGYDKHSRPIVKDNLYGINFICNTTSKVSAGSQYRFRVNTSSGRMFAENLIRIPA